MGLTSFFVPLSPVNIVNYRDRSRDYLGIGMLIIIPFDFWAEWLILPANGAEEI